MNQDRIWDYFQNDADGLHAFRVALPRYAFVAARVPKGRVLNIGVGSGGLETLLDGRGRQVYSLDPSEKSIASLRGRLGWEEDRARVGYSQSLPFDNATFDAVVMTEVLEHLDDNVLAATLREVARVAKPGATFLGTVPADEDLLAQTVVCPGCGHVHHRWGHVQSFSAARLATLLDSTFIDTGVRHVMFGMGTHLNWKGKLGWALKRAALAFGVHGSGESLYFQATRR